MSLFILSGKTLTRTKHALSSVLSDKGANSTFNHYDGYFPQFLWFLSCFLLVLTEGQNLQGVLPPKDMDGGWLSCGMMEACQPFAAWAQPCEAWSFHFPQKYPDILHRLEFGLEKIPVVSLAWSGKGVDIQILSLNIRVYSTVIFLTLREVLGRIIRNHFYLTWTTQ